MQAVRGARSRRNAKEGGMGVSRKMNAWANLKIYKKKTGIQIQKSNSKATANSLLLGCVNKVLSPKT